MFGNDFIGSSIRFFHFRKVLKKIKFNDCLDAGCGTGDFSFYVAGKYPDSQVDAFDISESIIKENNIIKRKLFKSGTNLSFTNKDLLKLNVRNKYGFIFSMVALIYFTDKQNKEILKNLFGALKPRGFLYLDLPKSNFESFNIIPKKYYKNWIKHTSEQQGGHLYSYKQLRSILKSVGFRIIDMHNTFGYAGKLAWEIDAVLKENKLNGTKMVILPLLKVLTWLDSHIKNRDGSCVSILCQKIKR